MRTLLFASSLGMIFRFSVQIWLSVLHSRKCAISGSRCPMLTGRSVFKMACHTYQIARVSSSHFLLCDYSHQIPFSATLSVCLIRNLNARSYACVCEKVCQSWIARHFAMKPSIVYSPKDCQCETQLRLDIRDVIHTNGAYIFMLRHQVLLSYLCGE